jgi:hypothetical protein
MSLSSRVITKPMKVNQAYLKYSMRLKIMAIYCSLKVDTFVGRRGMFYA